MKTSTPAPSTVVLSPVKASRGSGRFSLAVVDLAVGDITTWLVVKFLFLAGK
jgi:hypothetical protein